MVKRYRAIAKSPDPEADSTAAEGSATVKDPLNGEVVLQWKGRRLWGAVDQPGPEAKALLDELGRRLSILDKQRGTAAGIGFGRHREVLIRWHGYP